MNSNQLMLKTARQIAETMTQERHLTIAEICDFGDALGFAFKTKTKNENVFYCFGKRKKEISTFQPNSDPARFATRKIITRDFMDSTKEG